MSDPFSIGGSTKTPTSTTTVTPPINEVQPPGSNATQVYNKRNMFGFVGGTVGYVTSAYRADSIVGKDAKHFEWVITANLDNYGQGENVAGYFRAVRHPGASWTFGSVVEARDVSQEPGHLVAMEMDLFAHGPDYNNNRVGLDIAIGQSDVADPMPMEATAAVRVGPGLGDKRNRVKVVFGANIDCDVAFDSSQATMSRGGVALRLAAGQKIALEATNQICVRYNPTNYKIEFLNGNRVVYSINT